jgi:hypothetical protein
MTGPPTGSTRRDEPAREHRVELEATPAEALEAVEQASEIWGGEWRREGTGGTLTLPVSAGLRHGHVHGQVTTESRGARSALAFRIERIYYHVHVPAIVILLVGLFGGLLVVFAGFHPPLFELVPAGSFMSLAAWFLVVSKLRTRGSAEFLALVEELAGDDDRAAAESGPDR